MTESNLSAKNTNKKYTVESYNTFENMGLKENLLRGIFSIGFEKPSPIQTRAIKPVIDKNDVIGQAQSGTGKTATFLIATLQAIDETVQKPQALILAPTRELSEQIYNVLNGLSAYMKTKNMLLIGGTRRQDDIKKLEEGMQIIVGTPGRVFDMLKSLALRSDLMKLFVLDEADEMLSKGFQEQIYEIFQYIPKGANVALFSATMPVEALDLTKRFMNNPIEILVKKEQLTLEGIHQFYIAIEKEIWKLDTLCDLYEKLTIAQSIIYCNAKRKADWLKEQLSLKDFTVECLHSDMSQQDRKETMESFRTGELRVLIATDIIARGIDVQQVSIVINYDIPKYNDTYIHRIGRSGRYGRKGLAINFVVYEDIKRLKEIQDYYETQIEEMPQDISQFI